MSTITSATTVSKEERQSGTVRYKFRYELDVGEVHERIAWVSVVVDEATERTARGERLLTELAEAEAAEIIG